MRHPRLIPVAAATLALIATGAAPATAGAPEEVVGGLIGPLSVAVDGDGTVYVSQNFGGILTRKPTSGAAEDLYTFQGEVGAVSVSEGVVTFATSADKALLRRRADDGTVTTLANLTAYEKKNNPDADHRYGVVGAGEKCTAALKKRWRPYRGIVDAHPYATSLAPGLTYVADAGGNDILSVTDAGDVSTLAVLPATKIALTRKVRQALELPRCTRKGVLKVEPVPTDIERGPDGNLYVTSLPGGPEDSSLGANGAVFRVSPITGAVTRISSGLVTPTGLAIGPDGTAYISQLFAGVVLQVPLGGEPSVLAQVDFPGDVEYADGAVYVTRSDLTNPGDGSQPPNGAVLRIMLPAAP